MEILESISELVLNLDAGDDCPLKYDSPLTGHLNAKEMCELQSLIERWVIPIDSDRIEQFNKWISGPEEKLTQHEWIIERYTQLLLPHVEELGVLNQQEHSEEVLTSGLFCFLGQLIFYYSQYGTGCIPGSDKDIFHHINGIFDFVLLYIHVDHYLDNAKLPDCEKGQTLFTMIKLINNPTEVSPPAGMKGLVDAYIRILESQPEAKDILIKLFMTETVGIKYQKNPNLSREKYLSIAELKGGRTASAIQACMGDKITPEGYTVGVCVQLLDDMIDVISDRDNQITTLAVYDLKTYGLLDHMALYTARRINGLDSRFTIFKLLMMEILTYAIGQHSCYSVMLKRRINRSIHLRYNQGSKMMDIVNQWIFQTIIKMTTEKHS